jgi:fumarylpyruvate hydrolase
MSAYIFEPFIASLAIAGESARFPVRRILCVGRNYAAHAKEMGGNAREPPFFFMKPLTALLSVETDNTKLPIPPGTENYHHEVELVVALHKGGKNIDASKASEHIYGYAIGLDMTRRDLQRQFAEQKKPWEMGKAADFSAPVGPLHKLSDIGELKSGAISLSADNKLRQRGDLADMIWNVNELITYLSKFFTLAQGDIIFTGTPEGVGPVTKGQKIAVSIDKLGTLDLQAV